MISREKVEEKLASEVAGREAAIKAKEKLDGKYKDLKATSIEAQKAVGNKADELSSSSKKIEDLKNMNMKMEEEIEKAKLQKQSDDKQIRLIEQVR